MTQPILQHAIFARQLAWHATGHASLPYEVQVDKQHFEVRLNQLPNIPMYTLLINGKKVVDFASWPALWQR